MKVVDCGEVTFAKTNTKPDVPPKKEKNQTLEDRAKYLDKRLNAIATSIDYLHKDNEDIRIVWVSAATVNSRQLQTQTIVWQLFAENGWICKQIATANTYEWKENKSILREYQRQGYVHDATKHKPMRGIISVIRNAMRDENYLEIFEFKKTNEADKK